MKRGKGTMWWFYGDKDYISSSLEWELTDKGVILITDVKKNMKPKVMNKVLRFDMPVRHQTN
ncbi:Mobile element protein [Candidatus Enterovibrio escicola]|uniref:Mobile element protein n=1 Tax=Candidatus Enterovibrio escicola TaxID=1927127 RepID=A0A2A5T071_9GAMM|nr:transposase [Candidatus Enterovibrio escacola]PCS21508.1 Mobile element protein [Candidatus Enterovibrio escacola]